MQGYKKGGRPPHLMSHLAYDDWLDGKMKIEYEFSDLSPHEESVRRKEAKIMKVILARTDSGIHHLQLAHVVRIDRKNLTPYMQRLIRKELVRRGKGKQGKYYPTTKKYRLPIITADLFGKGAAGIILAKEDFPVDSPFFKINTTGTPLEYALVMFSTKLGSIISYLLIQSINPSNKIMGDTQNEKEKDLNVERWFDDAISSLQSFLLPIFKQLVISFLTHFKSLTEDFTRSDGSIDLMRGGLRFLSYVYNRPLYTLEQRFISELMTAFAKSYPSISAGLENMKSQLPRVVANEVNHWEYVANCSKQQRICKHDYKAPSNKSLAPRSNNNILHCHKCHKTKYKKIHS